jgi:hypothetical protein
LPDCGLRKAITCLRAPAIRALATDGGPLSCRSSTSRDLAEIEAGAEVLGELRLVEQEEPVVRRQDRRASLGMALADAYYNRWIAEPERSLAKAETLTDEAIERDPADPFAHGVGVDRSVGFQAVSAFSMCQLLAESRDCSQSCHSLSLEPRSAQG